MGFNVGLQHRFSTGTVPPPGGGGVVEGEMKVFRELGGGRDILGSRGAVGIF